MGKDFNLSLPYRSVTTKRSPLSRSGLNIVTSVLALSLALPATVGAVTTPANMSSSAPPAGQYAPPPSGADASGAAYDDRSQRYDRDYADRYHEWASRYCVDRRDNTAAGALIGGMLGAVAGSGLAGRGGHTAGAVVGGSLGATAGAAVGAATRPAACPPGYVVAPAAPVFSYQPGYYPPAVVYGPAWYQPWIWVDSHWVYRPYRYWYWTHRAYWRPDWRPAPWSYRYRRW
jgi:hypothetical protein